MACNCQYNDNLNRSIKTIDVYLNGYPCDLHRVNLNPKRSKKWHHILCEITNKINPYFGTIKKVYTSESGRSINSFSDLENNRAYVVSDYRKFEHVRGGYRKQIRDEDYFEHYLTGQLNLNNRLRKITYVHNHLIIIYVFNNGRNHEPPEKFVLTKDDLTNWDQTLSYIALVLDMPFRTIKSLYNCNGNLICGPWELQHGASYVAVGYNEKFIKRNYKIRELPAENFKFGTPVIHKNKNTPCYHKYGTNSWQQNLKWKGSLADLCYTRNCKSKKLKDKAKAVKSYNECTCGREINPMQPNNPAWMKYEYCYCCNGNQSSQSTQNSTKQLQNCSYSCIPSPNSYQLFICSSNTSNNPSYFKGCRCYPY